MQFLRWRNEVMGDLQNFSFYLPVKSTTTIEVPIGGHLRHSLRRKRYLNSFRKKMLAVICKHSRQRITCFDWTFVVLS